MTHMDTFNKFMVGAKGENVVVMMPPRGTISKEDARLLAAWLIAIADCGSRHEFELVLNAVLDT
jgi:cytochrome c551/c552